MLIPLVALGHLAVRGPIAIVDQLYDNVPTLKSISVCLNSLRVVSPQRRKSTRKDPMTRTESLVLTRLPPRAVADVS